MKKALLVSGTLVSGTLVLAFLAYWFWSTTTAVVREFDE
jgi:hypothetical protein